MQQRTQSEMIQRLYAPSRETSSFYLSIRVMLLLACLTAFSGGNVFAATYYVATNGNDNNSGTSLGSAWRTMTHAAAMMSPGDTTLVQDGTYEENIVRFSTPGTASNPITLKAQNRREAILSSRSSGSCQPAINIHASYIVIEGIRIQTSPNASPCGVYSAANLSIRVWHDESVHPELGGAQSSGYVGSIIRDVQVDPNADRCCAIKVSQDYAIVENSLLFDELEGMNSRGNIFRNNVIYHGGAYGNYISCKGGCRSFMMYGNIVHITTGKTPASWALGMSCGQVSGRQYDYDASTSIESYNCAAINNVIINDTSSPSVRGLMSQGSDISLFSNNILVNGIYYANGNSGGGRPPSNTILKNNIFLCNGQQALGGGTINGYFDEIGRAHV